MNLEKLTTAIYTLAKLVADDLQAQARLKSLPLFAELCQAITGILGMGTSLQLVHHPFLKDCALKWLLYFKRESLKKDSFCCDMSLYPTYPPKASLHKEGGLRLPPTKGAGRLCGSTLWRLAFGGYVGYRAMSRQQTTFLKDSLLKYRSHFKAQSFKRGFCAGWSHGFICRTRVANF
jgi:hypothetical protein